MRACARLLAAMVLALCAPLAHATFHTFRIDQLYTNADGTVQFVVLRESADADGEHLWGGRALTTTGAAGTQQITFPANLPSARTAGARVLVATPAFAALGIVAPDYTIPANFLPVGGGTINFAGVDQFAFGALPADGVMALSRAGIPMQNLATNFAGATGSVAGGPPTAVTVEFHHAGFDHYFVTHVAGEIALLDAGVTIKGWARTGQSFLVYAAAGSATSPVCRYYIPPEKGDSHFYGRGTAECEATGAANPTFFNEEPQFFHVVLPAAGVCPAGLVAVYRVFSNRPDANHRYTIDRAVRDAMTARSPPWLAEGDGDDLVVMCVPPVPGTAVPNEPPPTPGEPPEPPEYGGPPGYGGSP